MITHLKVDLGMEILLLAEGGQWMALEWSQTLLEADLELAPAPYLVDGPIASCCCLDLVLRTRQGRSPADF